MPETAGPLQEAEDPAYKLVNLDDVEDAAARFGLEDRGEVRPAREDLGARRVGVTHYRWKPGRRVGFGHYHSSDEEMYVGDRNWHLPSWLEWLPQIGIEGAPTPGMVPEPVQAEPERELVPVG